MGMPRPVALLAEGVDRNKIKIMLIAHNAVALLAEGVDRNNDNKRLCGGGGQVALLAEGVDRNLLVEDDDFAVCTSPSSRRAWIEIYRLHLNRCFPVVALLAEGVDRNIRLELSRRSFWVALLAEGVDRNTDAVEAKVKAQRRPPRGGRG